MPQYLRHEFEQLRPSVMEFAQFWITEKPRDFLKLVSQHSGSSQQLTVWRPRLLITNRLTDCLLGIFHIFDSCWIPTPSRPGCSSDHVTCVQQLVSHDEVSQFHSTTELFLHSAELRPQTLLCASWFPRCVGFGLTFQILQFSFIESFIQFGCLITKPVLHNHPKGPELPSLLLIRLIPRKPPWQFWQSSLCPKPREATNRLEHILERCVGIKSKIWSEEIDLLLEWRVIRILQTDEIIHHPLLFLTVPSTPKRAILKSPQIRGMKLGWQKWRPCVAQG